MPSWGHELTKIFESPYLKVQIKYWHCLRVKCSIFQALSSAIKFVDCGGVCKARDDDEETGASRLIRAAATFCGCCSPASDDIKLKIQCRTKEPKMEHRKWTTKRSPHPLLCNRRNPYAVSTLKTYQIRTDFWGIHKNGVILVYSEIVQFYIFASHHENDEIHAEV